MLGGLIAALTTSFTRQELVEVVAAERAVIDRLLPSPAAWRGRLRGHHPREAPGHVDRYWRTFAQLGQMARARGGRGLNADLLCEVHDAVRGGRRYRSGPVRVGRSVSFPTPRVIPGQIADAITDLQASDDAPPVKALKIQLRLLAIHPFRDGNGRTARLAGSFLLMQAGFRSSLFTATEEHASALGPRYSRSTRDYVDGAIDECAWVRLGLASIAAHALLVTWRLTARARPPRDLADAIEGTRRLIGPSREVPREIDVPASGADASWPGLHKPFESAYLAQLATVTSEIASPS